MSTPHQPTATTNTAPTVHLVHEPGEGIHGLGATLAAAQALAAERVSDYFGDPITWTEHGAGTDRAYWEGIYSTDAHTRGRVVVEAHPVHGATPAPQATTHPEWGVLRETGPDYSDLSPSGATVAFTESEARYLAASEGLPLIRRERTRYTDAVTDWREIRCI